MAVIDTGDSTLLVWVLDIQRAGERDIECDSAFVLPSSVHVVSDVDANNAVSIATSWLTHDTLLHVS